MQPQQPYNSEEWRTITDEDWEVIQAARPGVLNNNLINALDNLFITPTPIHNALINTILNAYLSKDDKTDEEYKDYKGGALFTYLESRWETVTRNTLKYMCTYEPRLRSFEVADCLLSCSNIEAVRGMEDAGYVPDENLAKQLFCFVLDWYESSGYTQEEDNDKVNELTPVINYLMEHNLGHIINHDVFDFARNHQED